MLTYITLYHIKNICVLYSGANLEKIFGWGRGSKRQAFQMTLLIVFKLPRDEGCQYVESQNDIKSTLF